MFALPDLTAYEEEVADRGYIEGLTKMMTEEGEGEIVKMPMSRVTLSSNAS